MHRLIGWHSGCLAHQAAIRGKRFHPTYIVGADALRQLRGRSVDARLRALESLLPLADAAEKDALTVQIKRLADEKRSLGVQHWGMVRRSR